MRIVHVSDVYLPALGGIELHVHDLARQQRRLGHDSKVMTVSQGGRRDDHGRADSVDVPVHRFSARGLTTPLATALATGDAVRLMRAEGVDAIHVHVSLFSPFSVGVLRAAARAGIPAVVTMHSIWEEFNGIPRWLVFPLGAREWPVVWTAVSGAAAVSFARVLGGDVDVEVLPNAVDPEPWQAVASSRTTSRSVDSLRVVSVMRLVARKRPLPLIEILSRADRTLGGAAPITAEIVGDGPRLRGVQRLLRRRGLEDRVTLSGRLDRGGVSRALADADVYLAPARLESFGIAALEALLSGLPVLARAGSGVADFVTTGVEGMLLGSDVAMADALAALALDRPRLAEMTANASAATPGFTWDRVVGQTSTLYEAAAELAQPERRRAGVRRRFTVAS